MTNDADLRNAYAALHYLMSVRRDMVLNFDLYDAAIAAGGDPFPVIRQDGERYQAVLAEAALLAGGEGLPLIGANLGRLGLAGVTFDATALIADLDQTKAWAVFQAAVEDAAGLAGLKAQVQAAIG